MATTKKTRALTGGVSLFRGKTRTVISFTLTPHHRALLDDAAQRLVLSRSDTLALLIHRYARTVQLPSTVRPVTRKQP